MTPPKTPLSWIRRCANAHQRGLRLFAAWPVAVQGMVWMVLGGLLFSFLNTIARELTLHLDVYQSQFLRYLFGLLFILPWVWREGWRTYMPVNMVGQFWRGGVHTLGLILWFTALPKIPLADVTAIGFTGPIFIMLGAAWFLGESRRRDRWIAAMIGFAGVMLIIRPGGTGFDRWSLLGLASVVRPKRLLMVSRTVYWMGLGLPTSPASGVKAWPGCLEWRPSRTGSVCGGISLPSG